MPWRIVLPFCFLASCAPVKEPAPVAAKEEAPLATRAAAGVRPPVVAEVIPAAPSRAPQAFRTSLQGIEISGVSFDSRTHRLAVADQGSGPGTGWPDAKAAAASMGGIAAVNGGFFTPEGAPLGLVVSRGKRSGSVNRASSLGAGFYADDGSPALFRREQWSGRAGEALQSGPFLIENSKPVGGLSEASSTARTFIGWDGGTRWFLARSGTCSLVGLGRALAGAELGGVSIRSALNLDGGRSSDLWISGGVQGGPVSERPFWNKPVRNFLILIPRN